ncbi:uncharacterized protein LOC112346706 [Selaginella moellendorffii]|uniref:uncharacterized protein LOC112346706 n=1 Tax=Selaginella moellendorffii TaxID=88036 RepID=UPI000D1C6732|nr:uncharacterized protein LOC112346706 [Selaginella moellendorffii]|eukprot:XP_024531984.1 uncharacterized protein LOC112346706 [Selaginella moellendorffii]
MGKTKVYAVRKGRQPGIYESWDQCKRQTDGFKGCEYKSFSSFSDAESYMNGISPTKTEAVLRSVMGDAAVAKPRPKIACISADAVSAEELVHVSSSSCSKVKQGAVPIQAGRVYQVEFDGASKGNPGRAGAGALLKDPDGNVECEMSEGVGHATNNVAEYRGLILGLKTALDKGIKKIIVKGDSKLVCEQIMEHWKVRNEGLKDLWQEAMYLKSQFLEFKIQHVDREFNPLADQLANIGVTLPETKFVSSSRS